MNTQSALLNSSEFFLKNTEIEKKRFRLRFNLIAGICNYELLN